jgi:putative ABC transport system ATP-binding protein
VRADSFGFIFQTFNLIPTLTAHENVEAALIPLGIGHTERHARVTVALDTVGLGDRAEHLPGELSGGQQQRVAIARALVKEPWVLLADEPTGNLDEDTRDEIIALLDTLWRERRLTLVLVSHDSSVVRRAQRIGVMSRGRLSIRQDTRALLFMKFALGQDPPWLLAAQLHRSLAQAQKACTRESVWPNAPKRWAGASGRARPAA